MKKRLTPVVAVLALAVSASVAHADGLSPATGAWKGSASDSGEFVSFKVVKTGSGYQAKSTRALVAAGCAAPNPNDSTTGREFRLRGVTLKLKAVGKSLRGTKTLKTSRDGGKASETVTIAVRFTSTRRAKIVVKAKYRTKKFDPTSNADNCTGGLTGNVEPQPRD